MAAVRGTVSPTRCDWCGRRLSEQVQWVAAYRDKQAVLCSADCHMVWLAEQESLEMTPDEP